MKKILILQMRPEDATANSEFEAIMRVGGLKPEEVQRVRLEQGIPDIKLKDYAAIIVGGSPFDLSTPPADKSETQKNIEAFFNKLLEEVVQVDFPFLGCCSGNGLLGKFCGVSISRTYSEPIGSVMISVTEEGAADPLLKGLPDSFLARVGHKEACDTIPDEAVLLATSDPCPVQMFRIKKNIYATQFHPEADAHEFIMRIKTYKNFGYFPPEQAEDLIAAALQIKTPKPKEILKRFVAAYK
ncbi:glutamine amidotransferase [Lentiprolixibacter aurantiacus]|uniref:Glutamine amidotransferase n=1 Tax=Lentiprolixibacter aurantiacus TaxID=2993939 RepID=A0AAE3MJ15_9FLAO|nr:glutamine amidotransferase [Lentiprolixibacter aurantiacus]MCX2718133.1 glutamine amidotransferase [Lentiprolixibacter aurantiacus]